MYVKQTKNRQELHRREGLVYYKKSLTNNVIGEPYYPVQSHRGEQRGTAEGRGTITLQEIFNYICNWQTMTTLISHTEGNRQDL
jgi:hypothetical protein